MTLTEQFQQETTALTQLKTRRDVAQEQAMRLGVEKKQADVESILLGKVTALLHQLGEQARSVVTRTIDPLGQQALVEIFGEHSRFETVFRKLPKSGYSARITSGTGKQIGNPLATDGGSVAEVLSDAVLRPLVLCLHQPPLARFMALDEPFAGVDAKRAEALGGFLRELTDRLGLQIIITTHEMARTFDQYADKVIEL